MSPTRAPTARADHVVACRAAASQRSTRHSTPVGGAYAVAERLIVPKPRRGRWLRWRALRPPGDDAVVGEDLNHQRVEYLSAAMADGHDRHRHHRFDQLALSVQRQLIECNSRIVCVENITEIAVRVGAVQL